MDTLLFILISDELISRFSNCWASIII